jgi:hypothetical protein
MLRTLILPAVKIGSVMAGPACQILEIERQNRAVSRMRSLMAPVVASQQSHGQQ